MYYRISAVPLVNTTRFFFCFVCFRFLKKMMTSAFLHISGILPSSKHLLSSIISVFFRFPPLFDISVVI